MIKNKNFRWVTSIVASHNENKLIKFTNDIFTTTETNIGWLNTPMGAYPQHLVAGESLGTFYAPIYLGTNPDGTDNLKKFSRRLSGRK